MMGLFDFLGRGRKAAPTRSASGGSSVTYLAGQQQGQRMTSFAGFLRALSVPNVAKCVSVVASNASATPLLWRDQEGNDVDLQTAAPDLYQLLKRPNAETRPITFTQSIICDLLLTGNFFCLLDEYDGLGRPHALYRLSPDRVRIIRSDVGNLAFGYDTIQNGVTNTEWYDQSNILHIKTFFNPANPLFGLGVVEMSELAISRDRLIGEFSLNFFSKGAIVDSVLVSPNEISEDDRKALIESWNSFRSGNRNRFKTAVLASGVEFQKIQESVSDIQLPELANMALEDVCQCFGVPRQMLGSFESSNYRNSQESNSFFITETLSPLLRQVEQDFWRPLGEYFDPDLDPFYRVREVHDFQLRSDSALKLSQTGSATVNQILVMAGLDPRDDALGDQLVIPQGVTYQNAAETGALGATKSYPEQLLSQDRREEQRRARLVQRPPRDPAEGVLRLLQSAVGAQDASQALAGAKALEGAGDAPEGAQGRKARVTVSARPDQGALARVEAAYTQWQHETSDELWEAVPDGDSNSAG